MDEEREKDIQELCRQVLEHSVYWEYSSNRYDAFVCMFCGAETSDRNSNLTIKHKNECAYLIAKDLSAKH